MFLNILRPTNCRINAELNRFFQYKNHIRVSQKIPYLTFSSQIRDRFSENFFEKRNTTSCRPCRRPYRGRQRASGARVPSSQR